MALEMADRLDDLYVAALDQEMSPMCADAVSACARWCRPTTTHAQMTGFVERQMSSLGGLDHALGSEVRAGWEWLASELGAVPMTRAEPIRLVRIAGPRDRVGALAQHGRMSVAA